MPPVEIDGNPITGATIDGTDVTEITVDGDTVFTAQTPVPDQANLFAHYDAFSLSLSNNSNVNTWPDLSGNGHDLGTNSPPVFKSSGIGADPGVQYDFNGNTSINNQPYHDVTFSSLSQPNTIYAVIDKFVESDILYAWDGATNNNRNWMFYNHSQNEFLMSAGGSLSVSSSVPANPFILLGRYDGSNSLIEASTNSNTGNAGSNPLDGFTLGNVNADQGHSRPVGGVIGECLIYDTDHSTSTISNVKQYFRDRWTSL